MSGTYTGPQRELSLEERRTIIDRVLSPRSPSWEGAGDFAYIDCPGRDLHTNGNGKRDCRVYAREAPGRTVKPPGVYCLHTSCASVLAPLNFAIRSELGKAKVRGLGAGGSSGNSSSRNGQPTARTAEFKAPPKGGDALPTARTVISKPLVQFARAQVRAHSCSDVRSAPSVPSAVASTQVQPAQPEPLKAPASAPAMPSRPPASEKTVPPKNPPSGEKLECTLILGSTVEKGHWVGENWIRTKKLPDLSGDASGVKRVGVEKKTGG